MEQMQQNALDLLQQDHQKVEQLMQQFQSQGMQGEQLAEQIFHELLVHAKLEQDIFYPAVRAGTDQDIGNRVGELAAAADIGIGIPTGE